MHIYIQGSEQDDAHAPTLAVHIVKLERKVALVLSFQILTQASISPQVSNSQSYEITAIATRYHVLSGMKRLQTKGSDPSTFWSLLWLHGWEKQNFFNVVMVCQHHGQAVNAHTPTTCGRQAILQALTEALVDVHGLSITLYA
jgi:hypothetical protein